MNGRNAVDRVQLHSEAWILEQLLRQYIYDRKAISKHERRYIYFIDAHDLKAYLHIDRRDFLDGFMLNAEKATMTDEPSGFLLDEIRLKSEQALQWLLFEQESPVILLPSHGEEIDEELAYIRKEQLVRTLGLVAAAKRQIEKIRSGAMAEGLINSLALQALQDNEDSRDRLIAILKVSAPAVAVLLGFTPDTTTERVDTLVRDSQLVPLADVDWSSFGSLGSLQSELEAIAPDLLEVDEWRSVLTDVRSNTPPANQRDAEAIAYLCTLNNFFERNGRSCRAVLVTRAMSLLHAIRSTRSERLQSHRTAIDSVRHTRLLAAHIGSVAEDTKTPDADSLLRNLSVVLGAYERQLRPSRGQLSEESLRVEVAGLVGAWQEFEGARSTLWLRDKPRDSATLGAKPRFDESQFRDFNNWLNADGRLEDLVLNRFAEGLRSFEQDMFIRRSEFTEPILARAVPDSPAARRAFAYPMVPTFIGPIALDSKAIEDAPNVHSAGALRLGEIIKLRVAPAYSDMDASEAYLTWALQYACQGIWRLAGIYAESSIAAAGFLRKPATQREASLLLAQILRLAGQPESSEAKVDERSSRTDRFERAKKLLGEFVSPTTDIRFLIELQALAIERSVLTIRDAWKSLDPLLEVLDGFRRMRIDQIADRDPKLAIRAMELRTIAVSGIESMGAEALKAAKLTLDQVLTWHNEFIRLITALRLSSEYTIGDIARQARGVEILSYQLVSDMQREKQEVPQSELARPPSALMVDVHEVQAMLWKSADLTSGYVMSRLTLVIEAVNHDREYNLVYAPVWTRDEVDLVLQQISEPAARASALRANEIVHILGDGQSILDNNDGDFALLQDARSLFCQSLSILGEGANSIDFYVRMELCYADLLHAQVLRDPDEKRSLLLKLAEDYVAIANRYAHLRSAVVHYRLSIVYSELTMKKKAFEAISEAIRSQRHDESTGPRHWVRSTMRRRMGLYFAGQANDLLAELEKDPENHQLRQQYLSCLRDAFITVYEEFEEDSREGSHRATLEARRRLNNIVYYASLYARGGGNVSELCEGFSEKELERYVQRLHSGRVAKVSDWGILHTIGVALEVLGKIEEAGAIADRLWDMLAKSGPGASSRETAQVLADAMRWNQTRNSRVETLPH